MFKCLKNPHHISIPQWSSIFQKAFVLPNMDDIYLPLMHSGMENVHPTQFPPHSSVASTERCDMEQTSELQ